MGDSITEGSPSSNYRTTLRTILTNAGYDVDYVGTYTANPGTLTDREHEGHSGWRIDQLDSNVSGWFSAIEDPDFILLHIGTNDFGQNFDTANAINRWDALILKMATLRPHANIVVTNIMQRSGAVDTNIQNQFNAFVQARVNAHIAAGRKVTFLDMRAAVPLSDMPDGLHPNQTGSDKMANAWLGAIQALSTPEGDFSAPAISRIRGSMSRTEATVTFSKPVADSAANLANFAIDGGLTISSATLDATKRKVTLVTSAQTENTVYTVTVNNIVDRQTPTPNAIAPNSIMTFVPPIPRGYQNHIAESEQYALAYSLDIPSNAYYRQAQPNYQVDNRASVGPFDRVAYYLELQADNGELQYVWTSMDAFTQDAGKIAVPTFGSGAFFQQPVTNLTVRSNVAGLATGNSLSGNIEFWPSNYEKGNSANVTGASATHFDFGDQPSAGDYGSMQVHNTGAAQTVFAFNHWGGTGQVARIADLGIGNDPSPVNDGRDWTFHNNAGAYNVKTLQVLVRTTGDHTAPTLVSAMAAASRSQVVVNFSEPLATASVSASDFSLDNGVSVLSATLSADRRSVTLQTSTHPQAVSLTLSVGEVRDSSANANPIAAGASIAVSTETRPAEVIANVGAASAGYQLVLSADLPTVGNFVARNPYKFDDRSAPGNFTKVAYYLELQQQGQPTRYVWTSMDAFTGGRHHIGIPTTASGAVYQQNVTNLEVLSNAPGIVTGTTATGGNIEFWPHSYTQANGIAIPNANAGTYDTGDTRTTGTYGSMQVHNHDAGANQTIFALNHFGADGSVLDLGIGNNTAPVDGGVDWTFAANAGNYSKRTLHVLVLPGTTTSPDLIAKVPEAEGYQLAYSVDVPASGNMQSGTGAFTYQKNFGTALGPFTRVAYYMELNKTGDPAPTYVWTSMDAFTTNGARIGVPTGWMFQQQVTNMNVFSNAPGVVTGTNIATGNIEFFPSNYNQSNPLAIPNASPAVFDFGDGGAGTGQGHGSMQVHNYGASQTLFALNRWGSANTNNPLCIGIGNGPAPDTDWTFANNAATWNLKRLLQVYVLPGNSDLAAPAITAVRPSIDLDAVRLTFSEPIAENSASAAVVDIPGLSVLGVEMQGSTDLIVRTSAQTAGAAYTVNVSGVRDRSPAANTTARTANFNGYTAPAVFANVPEISGYRHMLSLGLPGAVPNYNNNGVNYDLDERRFGDSSFDRVAYLMELNGNWAYASFDAHTRLPSQIGVPTLTTNPVPIQQIVTHMNVASNVAGVTNGTDIATGNIEFWGGNYEAGNDTGIPGASSTLFDFGDRMTNGGHGSMQIHNHGAGHTIMGFNNWGSNLTGNSEMGIGNNTPINNAIDWTFAANANSYTTKRLYVLVRASAPAAPGSLAAQFHGEPGTRIADAGEDVTFTVSVAGPGPFTYQWRHNGVAIEGATNPWLDLSNISGSSSGTYDVIVTGPGMVATTSPGGTLIVTGLVLSPNEIHVTEAGDVSLSFYGDPGRIYEIQRSTTLGGWETLDEMQAPSNGEMPYLDDEAPEPKAFYRAVPLPQP
ncbi:GDSL-type esterase/lipase family protein [Luteolibacter sp. GHJ8]|uniref:GDSL-type esterase/lipase family protein n=1 Tax=Luteolibacter rhizosphaerae TaxID=2989719 RepID=A0ABT3G939_9BACT|nr:GDSL-type esterase/lipase family protein [Luteolibacter rhizosphaerae]MCW1916142.1 GDSL-type esterase/lipase family protein [Luteolibacter rhizosphaerae]